MKKQTLSSIVIIIVITLHGLHPLQAQELWGVTPGGGEHGAGTVFKIKSDGTFAKVMDFAGWVDEEQRTTLYSNLVWTGFEFYGVAAPNQTDEGGGVVLKLTDYGYYSKIYGGGSSGIYAASVTKASNQLLYVVTPALFLPGNIIRLFPERVGVERLEYLSCTRSENKVVHVFKSTKSEGSFATLGPRNPLLELSDGFLYGMAPDGGATGSNGVIYRMNLDGSTFQVIYRFNTTYGKKPTGALIDGKDGYLYGLTSAGGIHGFGSIFKIKPDGTGFKKLHDFNGATGGTPYGDLTKVNDVLYGMTYAGGAVNLGVIFKINQTGTGYTKLIDFDGTNGANPMGGLTADANGELWGMTLRGGTLDKGTLFKFNQAGNTFTKVHDFTGSNGANPIGSLTLKGEAMNLLSASQPGPTLHANVSPNPFTSTLKVELLSQEVTAEPVTIVIHSLSGVKLKEFETTTGAPIQLGDEFPKGIYIMKMIKGDAVAIKRIMKN